MMETGSITAQPDALRTASDQLTDCADTVSRLRDGHEANPPRFCQVFPSHTRSSARYRVAGTEP